MQIIVTLSCNFFHTMHYVFINIGTNLGDRRLNLSRAMRAVGNVFGEFEMSHVVESEPWGYSSDNKYLNLGMAFATDMEPEDVLDELQKIEQSLSPDSHRNADGSYADRIIDIDIVAIDNMMIDTERLKVPHPHLSQRDFFLAPLEELASGWRHPATGESPSEMRWKLKLSSSDS